MLINLIMRSDCEEQDESIFFMLLKHQPQVPAGRDGTQTYVFDLAALLQRMIAQSWIIWILFKQQKRSIDTLLFSFFEMLILLYKSVLENNLHSFRK